MWISAEICPATPFRRYARGQLKLPFLLARVVIIGLLKCMNVSGQHLGDNYDNEDYLQPEQIHLSLGADETEMTVTWLTLNATNLTAVEFGPKSGYGVRFTRRILGSMSLFTDGGSERRNLYIHRVTLKNLKPGFVYYYHCGDPDWGWSAVYWFQATRNDATFDPRFLIYGDMGNKNGRALSTLQEEVQKTQVDAVLHVGDLAYDLADDNARRGDQFMRQIETIAAYVPYQVTPGNHEYHYNFSNYDARFSMYNKQERRINNHFYSFNIGPVHIVSISTEFYYLLQFGYRQIKSQYDWLVRDLTEANKQENRIQTPWIFLLGHRPMYCTNAGNSECADLNNIVRAGMPFSRAFALEPLLKKFGVDVMWAGHQHSYERIWPIFNGTVLNRTKEAYNEPQGPVHIITGSPGCEEGLSPYGPDPLSMSAFHTDHDYTFSRVHIVDKSHIDIEQVSVPTGAVVDKISIKKALSFPKWQEPDLPLDTGVYRI
ncbi:acid phosphatase type 7-like [Varroa destructor]|uniref:Purple acid phosphatase n=1 Tax=Varroa destructor TaxID=109461 RepID=A0A7M7JFG1_VARDE|nr:acid phosphatase type 7-like [Varroa destructor]